MTVTVNPGETVFLLGANGTGKSNLMHLFTEFTALTPRGCQLIARLGLIQMRLRYRPKESVLSKNSDTNLESRWKDDYAPQRPNIAVYDLIDAENVRARSITRAVDADDIDLAKSLAQADAPITVINEILRLSNIPIEISVHENDKVVASRSGGPAYSIAQKFSFVAS